MRDLAFLSMARTYYSASVRLDENNAPTHRQHEALGRGQVLEQGRRRRASTGSTRSSRSRGRTSWPATTRTRSATSTRSSRRTSRTRSTRKRTFSRRSSTSRTASTTTRRRSSRKFQQKYQPIYDELDKVLEPLQGRGPGRAVLQVPEGSARRQGGPPADASSRSSRTRSRDRQLLRNLEYVQVLDDEEARFKKAPASFQDSPLGNDVKDALQLARDLAVRNAGQLARERYQRNLDELNEHLRDARRSSSTSPPRSATSSTQAIAGAQVTAAGVEGATS